MQALKRTVLNEAQAEAERILDEAHSKAADVQKRAEEQASADRAAILAHATQEADRLRSQAVASAHLQARTKELARREKLLDDVFDAARQQLSTVQQRADYDQIARRLLKEALEQLGANAARVWADDLTRTHLPDEVLAAVSAETGVQVRYEAPLDHGTGLIVQTEDGHRQYDNTLEARLDRQQNALRVSVLRLLTGEDS
jgi:V/A-type H+/Na+-transporting ATPase subunit E